MTKEEILGELEKLGINTTSELKTYVREYMVYYNRYINPSKFKRFRNHNNNCKNSYMERRLTKRIPVSLEAELINGYISYAAFIGNISEYGLYMIIVPIKTAKNFTPRTKLELKLQLPLGETLNLYCKQRWSYTISSRGLTKKMGIEIIDPPTKYKEFFKTL